MIRSILLCIALGSMIGVAQPAASQTWSELAWVGRLRVSNEGTVVGQVIRGTPLLCGNQMFHLVMAGELADKVFDMLLLGQLEGRQMKLRQTGACDIEGRTLIDGVQMY